MIIIKSIRVFSFLRRTKQQQRHNQLNQQFRNKLKWKELFDFDLRTTNKQRSKSACDFGVGGGRRTISTENAHWSTTFLH